MNDEQAAVDPVQDLSKPARKQVTQHAGTAGACAVQHEAVMHFSPCHQRVQWLLVPGSDTPTGETCAMQ